MFEAIRSGERPHGVDTIREALSYAWKRNARGVDKASSIDGVVGLFRAVGSIGALPAYFAVGVSGRGKPIDEFIATPPPTPLKAPLQPAPRPPREAWLAMPTANP